MTPVYLTLVVAGVAVLFLGLFAGYVKSRLWIAETTVCLAVGILVGPALLGTAASLHLDPLPHLKEVARITLAIAVMGAALRLPPAYVARRRRDLAIVLGLGLTAMWLTGAALAAVFLGLALLPALLVGAVLCPTDPVVANSIVTGGLAERCLPARMRNLLTAESGANDGLALAFVLLPVLFLMKPAGAAALEWVGRVLLWEVCGGVLIGGALGLLVGTVLKWMDRQPFADRTSTLTVSLALSLTVLATARLAGSDGILAVFVAGLMLNRAVPEEDARQEGVQEAIGRFFDLPVFILFGALLPWEEWVRLGWPALAFAGAVLLLKRLPWWIVLGRAIGEVHHRCDALFMGWFGPIGISTLFYALLATERTGLGVVWPIASLVVFVSVIAHGVSATPLTRRFGRARQRIRRFGERPTAPASAG